jgi:capsular exopolysaccharide synthesis family protein
MWTFKVKGGRALENKKAHTVCKNYLRFLNSNPEMGQSYETLLSSLHLLNTPQPLKTILVTSTQPEEGKTTVTLNLALTMMLVGKKVLVLDTDLRKPRFHQLFKLENTQGLVDILTRNECIQDMVQVVHITDSASEHKQTLSVITSGRVPSNSFNAIGSPKLKEVMEYSRNVYDVVLCDSAPVLTVSDPLVLAPMVDGIILVLNAGAVTEKDAQHAKERLEQAGGYILGVVMNRFDEKLHGPGFHPYYGYYRRSVS